MTTSEKWILALALIAIAGMIIYFNRDKIFKPRQEPSQSPEKNAYEKCVEANKSKKDGEECSNCTAEGSGMPSFNGVIKDGVCVQKEKEKRYVIINQSGAPIYLLQGGNFTAPQQGSKVPFRTEVKIEAVSPNRDFYRTQYGWLHYRDVGMLKA